MHQKVGIGILVIHEGKILLGKRVGAHGEGSWGFPGGHLESHETILECTARELLEETGLIAKKMHKGSHEEVHFPDDGKRYLNFFTFVTHFSGKLENREPEKNTGWHWIDIENLPNPLFEPIKKIAIQNSLKSYIETHLSPSTETSISV